MIRLELTLQESEFLQQWLMAPSLPGQQEVDQRRQLLAKVTAARQQALQEQICPVCDRSFTQLTRGRTGRYCSNACKQKAYRQRAFEWRRQHWPPARR